MNAGPPPALQRGAHDVRLERPWSLNERSGALLLMILTPAVLLLDYTSGRDYSLHLLYLAPTGLAAWSFGARVGYAIAFMAASYWAFVGFATHHPGAPATSLAWDVASTLALFLFFAFVVARHRAFVDGLIDTARLDAASGALAKREFSRLFETEVRRARRYGRPVALALFDVGGPKAVAKMNEKRLATVVRAVQSQIRDSDAIGRVSDWRLGIVLVECAAPEAFRVAARIRDELAAKAGLDPPAPPIGLVSYGGAGEVHARELMQSAALQLTLAQAGPGLSDERIL